MHPERATKVPLEKQGENLKRLSFHIFCGGVKESYQCRVTRMDSG